MVERPPLLVSSDGVLAGVLGPEGRALSAPRGAGFAAESWLADDGDLADPKAAAAREGFAGPKSARQFEVAGIKGVVLSGKDALTKVAAACAEVDLVLVPVRLGPVAKVPSGCTVLDATYLAQSGAVAGLPDAGGLLLVPVRAEARVWTGNAEPVSPVLVRRNPARMGPAVLALGGGN
jgi:competence protein ComEC